MSVRLLIFVMFLAGLAAYFSQSYRSQSVTLQTSAPAHFDYWVEDINMLQTDEQGNIAYTLRSDTLNHNMETNVLKLNKVDLTHYVYDDKSVNVDKTAVVNFKATDATWQRDSKLINLDDGVSVKRTNLMPNVNSDDAVQTFTAQNMQYNTQNYLLNSDNPVRFNFGIVDYIHAKSVRANLNTGMYTFTGVNAKHQPKKQVVAKP